MFQLEANSQLGAPLIYLSCVGLTALMHAARGGHLSGPWCGSGLFHHGCFGRGRGGA